MFSSYTNINQIWPKSNMYQVILWIMFYCVNKNKMNISKEVYGKTIWITEKRKKRNNRICLIKYVERRKHEMEIIVKYMTLYKWQSSVIHQHFKNVLFSLPSPFSSFQKKKKNYQSVLSGNFDRTITSHSQTFSISLKPYFFHWWYLSISKYTVK